MKQYKSLEKSNDYDHDKADEYAEAVMELKSLQSRREYLQELIDDHSDLKDYMWTTAEGVTLPFHKIEDDHLKNIMTHLIDKNRRIPAQIKAEARSRNLEVPDDSMIQANTIQGLLGGVKGGVGKGTLYNAINGEFTVPF